MFFQMGGLFSIVKKPQKTVVSPFFFYHSLFFYHIPCFSPCFPHFFPVVYIPHYHSSWYKKWENTEQLATRVHGLNHKGLGVDIGELCTVS